MFYIQMSVSSFVRIKQSRCARFVAGICRARRCTRLTNETSESSVLANDCQIGGITEFSEWWPVVKDAR